MNLAGLAMEWRGASAGRGGGVAATAHATRLGDGRTTSRKLDPFGRTVELTDPDGVRFTTTYARCGSDCAAVDGVKVETDSSITPKVTRYLDKLGRVVRVRTESFAGPLTGCGGTPDFLKTLAYGSDARPSSATTVIRADGQTARSHARSFTYDGSGRLLTESHPSGVTTLREYNARGYLAAIKENTTKKVLERYTAADAFGSVTAVTHGNGAKTAREFDANTGRMTGVETTHGGGASKTVAQDFGFEWRTDGTLEKRAKGSGMSELTETFTRDPLRRLTRAKVSGAGGRQLDYDHDALGNLLHRNSSTAST